MPDLGAMRRILHGHAWETCDEWARAIGQLADLTDEQILSVADGNAADTWSPVHD
jgi:hypothetical protein